VREIDASGPFKRSTRMPLDAVVRLHFEGTVAYQNGFAANVSATGMFVKHPDPPHLGTRLVFEFVIGEERRPVQGAGLVAWVRERYEGPGRPAGIGIQFTEVDAQSRQHLAEALFEYLEMSLGAESADAGELVAPAESEPEPAPAAPDAYAPDEIPAPTEPAPAAFERPTRSFAMATPAEGIEPETDFSPAIPPEPAAQPAGDRSATFSYALPGAEPEAAAPVESEEERIDRMVRAALAEEPIEVAGAAAVRPRALPLWVWIAAGLALLVAGWGGWQYWWMPRQQAAQRQAAAPPRVEPTPTPRPPLPALGEPQTTLADTVGATDAAKTAPEIPLPKGVPSPGEDEAGEEVTEPAGGAVNVAETEAPAPTATSPTPALAPAPVPEPAVAASETGPPRARALADIDWTEATGVTVVTLAGDGPFPPGSFSYSEIGGEKPRVLVRFKGLELPFQKSGLKVGTSAVAGIRTGWHERPEGHEQHVVVDLAGPDVRLEGFEALGSRIVLKLAKR